MKAAVYCRLSKEDEDRAGESESIQNQRSMLLRYAAEQGFEVYGVYCDEDYSGADRQRPAFNAMLRDAAARRFDVVLAKTQSRFTRDMELVERYLHGKFAEWGIRFIAVVDHVDTQDPASKKSRQINGLINEWYLEDLSSNVRAVLDHKRRQGQYIASSALYGYRKDPDAKGRLQPDPAAADVVRRIFALALDGAGARKIAQTLNAEGVPSPAAYKSLRGEGRRTPPGRAAPLWSAAAVSQMLHNQTYAGDLVQGRHKRVSYKSKKTVWLPREAWIVAPGTHEGLVSRADFETVQRMMAGRARSSPGGAVHPLARRVFCGCCGCAMEQCGSGTVRADGTRRRYIRCRTHQRAPARCANRTCTDLDALLEMVRGRVAAYAAAYFDPERLPPGPAGPDEQREQALRAELRRLEGEVEKRRRAVQALYLDRAAGLLSPEQCAGLSRDLCGQAEQAGRQIARLRAELAAADGEGETAAAQARQARLRELAAVPQLPRELAALLVGRVIVWPRDPATGAQEVAIEWLF